MRAWSAKRSFSGKGKRIDYINICGNLRDDLEEPTADGRTERWGIAYEELIPLTIHMTQKAFEKIENVERSMNELNKENMKISFLQSQIGQLYMYIGELQAKNSRKGDRNMLSQSTKKSNDYSFVDCGDRGKESCTGELHSDSGFGESREPEHE